MNNKQEFFSYENLSNFFESMIEYPSYTLKNCDGSNNGILLRFDIDLSLDSALEISKILRKLDLKASFFVRMTGNFYNSLTIKNQKIIREISKYFEIGLHFDPSVYLVGDLYTLQQKLDLEAILLGSIINDRISIISLHNPSIYGSFPSFKGYKSSYSRKLFKKENYLSDSLMYFRKDPYLFLKLAKTKLIQITLHPCHYGEICLNYVDIMKNLSISYVETIENIMLYNKTYKKLIKENFLVKRLTWND